MGWEGNSGQLREGAAQLAGLGSGLTPAGDDFLTGVMLWAWLAHSNPREFSRALVAAAAPRTTTLSAAFLRAAAEGECSAPWHRVLAALVGGAEDVLAASIRQVVACGATSGADTLAGFLWMAGKLNRLDLAIQPEHSATSAEAHSHYMRSVRPVQGFGQHLLAFSWLGC